MSVSLTLLNTDFTKFVGNTRSGIEFSLLTSGAVPDADRYVLTPPAGEPQKEVMASGPNVSFDATVDSNSFTVEMFGETTGGETTGRIGVPGMGLSVDPMVTSTGLTDFIMIIASSDSFYYVVDVNNAGIIPTNIQYGVGDKVRLRKVPDGYNAEYLRNGSGVWRVMHNFTTANSPVDDTLYPFLHTRYAYGYPSVFISPHLQSTS